jgi:CheY-like chemotaxis protein
MHILVAEDQYVSSSILLIHEKSTKYQPSPINQKVIAKLLSRLRNCTFALVGDGQQVLDYLAGPPATCPRPDLILMDVRHFFFIIFPLTTTLKSQ